MDSNIYSKINISTNLTIISTATAKSKKSKSKSESTKATYSNEYIKDLIHKGDLIIKHVDQILAETNEILNQTKSVSDIKQKFISQNQSQNQNQNQSQNQIKKSLGQFYTTNQSYVLQNMSIPDNITNIIEPFCGNGDLLSFVKSINMTQTIKSKYNIETYDIDPKHDYIIKRDTILNPPSYHNKFIITNPPYLARNKSKSKQAFDKYDVNDLYKCLIKELLTNKPLGGILIIPLNFWSSIRNSDIQLRKQFLQVYDILILNIFEEQVFDDTTYTICSFQFEHKSPTKLSNDIKIIIYPHNTLINTTLSDTNDYLIGGEIYKIIPNPNYKITRATSKNKDILNTNILVKCIDDNYDNMISLNIVSDDELYIDNTPNQTSRTYASLIIEPKITNKQQKILVDRFNAFLGKYRKKYNSLFLTNYRESKDIARKRISFELVYQIVGYLLNDIDNF